MVVVLKQGDKIVHAEKSDRPNSFVTSYPEVGYSTSKSFSFAMSAFDSSQPFTVVIANAVIDRGVRQGEVPGTSTRRRSAK